MANRPASAATSALRALGSWESWEAGKLGSWRAGKSMLVRETRCNSRAPRRGSTLDPDSPAHPHRSAQPATVETIEVRRQAGVTALPHRPRPTRQSAFNVREPRRLAHNRQLLLRPSIRPPSGNTALPPVRELRDALRHCEVAGGAYHIMPQRILRPLISLPLWGEKPPTPAPRSPATAFMQHPQGRLGNRHLDRIGAARAPWPSTRPQRLRRRRQRLLLTSCAHIAADAFRPETRYMHVARDIEMHRSPTPARPRKRRAGQHHAPDAHGAARPRPARAAGSCHLAGPSP